jgi:hypothetical protein
LCVLDFLLSIAALLFGAGAGYLAVWAFLQWPSGMFLEGPGPAFFDLYFRAPIPPWTEQISHDGRQSCGRSFSFDPGLAELHARGERGEFYICG